MHSSKPQDVIFIKLHNPVFRRDLDKFELMAHRHKQTQKEGDSTEIDSTNNDYHQ